ncbi:MAG: hypothetical protein J0M33_16030 [Anaerolineae bacterium]|nr:hypothetical protein [Anaerolineae bacterium]
MKLLSHWAVWIYAGLAVLTLLLMLPARSDAGRLERLGLTRCDNTPCWESLIPGLTTTEDAVALLLERGFIQQRPVIFRRGRTSLIMPLAGENNLCQAVVTLVSGQVTQAGVNYCFSRQVRVGDVLLAFGFPDQMRITSEYLVIFDQAAIRTRDRWLNPFSRVQELSLVVPPDDPQPVAWKGFAPLWKQCQTIQRAWYGCVPILRR